MRSLIIAAATAVFATSAMAADVVYDAPPAAPYAEAPMAYNWSGFYAGLNAGYGFGDADYTGTADGSFASFDVDGFVGGAQVGYNWQHGAWVFGLETDFQYSGADFGVSGPGFSYDNELAWFGTARARVGYAFDNVLPYVTGGFAYGRHEFNATDGALSASESRTHTGYAVGAGVEYGATEKVSLKLEYLYTDLGDKTYFNDFTNPISADLDFHTVRVGVNFRF